LNCVWQHCNIITWQWKEAIQEYWKKNKTEETSFVWSVPIPKLWENVFWFHDVHQFETHR
jgi:hypothetical protein